jgi:hypothetical protein
VTERRLWELQVAKYPEDKKLATNSLENMGVKELRDYLRKCNAARNRGELNEQFREWIFEQEHYFSDKIAKIFKVGNHKVQLAYYGMTYTILEHAGCYIKGKNSTPIGITRNRYCSELKLKDRLKSGNVRKAIANDFYGHNYVLAIAERKNGEKLKTDHIRKQLEPIFSELAYEIKKKFLD